MVVRHTISLDVTIYVIRQKDGTFITGASNGPDDSINVPGGRISVLDIPQWCLDHNLKWKAEVRTIEVEFPE